MLELGRKPENTSMMDLGILDGKAHWNLTPHELVRISLQKENARKTKTGALAIDTGEFTGRSPKDKFIVRDEITASHVWWGSVNASFDAEKFDQLYIKMIRYFEGKEFFVRDCYTCADWRYRMDIRVITEYAWSNLFVYNMFLRPEDRELKSFSPEWLILNAPRLQS